MCADLGSVAEQGLGLEQLLAVLDGLSRSERPLQDQAGGPEWGSAGRGSRGFLTPLAASPEPPSGTAIQTFLRELRSKLCVDPPHTGPLRSPGPDRTRRGSINDALLPPVGAPSGRRASSTPDAADSAANCGKTDASCVALTLALMVVSTVFVVTIVVVTLR